MNSWIVMLISGFVFKDKKFTNIFCGIACTSNKYVYLCVGKNISIIGEASAPTQFKQGKNFNIIQALFFVITGDVVLKSRSSLSDHKIKNSDCYNFPISFIKAANKNPIINKLIPHKIAIERF